MIIMNVGVVGSCQAGRSSLEQEESLEESPEPRCAEEEITDFRDWTTPQTSG